jgi:glutamate/tyrosine decarboxylase-like PLP-dependent enzyme
MNLQDLRKQLKEQKEAGHDLLIVNSTGGTTVEGVIDPITEIG